MFSPPPTVGFLSTVCPGLTRNPCIANSLHMTSVETCLYQNSTAPPLLAPERDPHVVVVVELTEVVFELDVVVEV